MKDDNASCMPLDTRSSMVMYNPHTGGFFMRPVGGGTRLFGALRFDSVAPQSHTGKPYQSTDDGVAPSHGVETRPLMPQPLRYIVRRPTQTHYPGELDGKAMKLAAVGPIDPHRLRNKLGALGLPVTSPVLKVIP